MEMKNRVSVTYHVTPTPIGWIVRRGSDGYTTIHDSKEEAVQEAEALAAQQAYARVLIYNGSGVSV